LKPTLRPSMLFVMLLRNLETSNAFAIFIILVDEKEKVGHYLLLCSN